MASTLNKAKRRADAVSRLGEITGVDLDVQHRGDPELGQIMQLERIADALGTVQGKGEIDLIAAIQAATVEELEAVPGIGKATATKIKKGLG
jgi:DNA uptake protein ComE-like DNA-binding protein